MKAEIIINKKKGKIFEIIIKYENYSYCYITVTLQMIFLNTYQKENIQERINRKGKLVQNHM